MTHVGARTKAVPDSLIGALHHRHAARSIKSSWSVSEPP